MKRIYEDPRCMITKVENSHVKIYYPYLVTYVLCSMGSITSSTKDDEGGDCVVIIVLCGIYLSLSGGL